MLKQSREFVFVIFVVLSVSVVEGKLQGNMAAFNSFDAYCDKGAYNCTNEDPLLIQTMQQSIDFCKQSADIFEDVANCYKQTRQMIKNESSYCYKMLEAYETCWNSYQKQSTDLNYIQICTETSQVENICNKDVNYEQMLNEKNTTYFFYLTNLTMATEMYQKFNSLAVDEYCKNQTKIALECLQKDQKYGALDQGSSRQLFQSQKCESFIQRNIQREFTLQTSQYCNIIFTQTRYAQDENCLKQYKNRNSRACCLYMLKEKLDEKEQDCSDIAGKILQCYGECSSSYLTISLFILALLLTTLMF